MKTIFDVIGRPIELNGSQYFVTATDKMMSGWGRAVGKTHKQIVICETFEEVRRVTRNMELQGFTYLNWGNKLPRYSSTRYTWSYHHVSDCPIWNK